MHYKWDLSNISYSKLTLIRRKTKFLTVYPTIYSIFKIEIFKTVIPIYYKPITDTTLEPSVFWPSDTESRINELRFSESISLSFKTRLTSGTCYFGDVT